MMAKMEGFSDEWWYHTEGEFYRMAAEVRCPYLQLKEEAIKRRGADGRAQNDPSTGVLVLGIPFRQTDDQELLAAKVQELLALIPTLERQFDRRRLSPQFVKDLCTFHECYGYVLSIVSATSDDLKHERAKEASRKSNRKCAQKKYMAKLLIYYLAKKNNRDFAEWRAFDHIRHIIERGVFQTGFPKSWFQDLLRGKDIKSEDIKTTYKRHAWPREEVIKLAAGDNDGIPFETLPRA
jgi:hypothetical protein